MLRNLNRFISIPTLRRRTFSTAQSDAESLLLTGEFKNIQFTHTTTFPVRWIDIDSMGHVNNAKFITYFEQARCEAFSAVGLNIGNNLPEGPILAKTSCTFRGPVLFPDVVTVGSMSEKTSSNSWIQKYCVVAHSSGRVVAEGDGELVWFDYANGKRKDFSKDANKRLFGIDED